jgi:sodium pump decarboxylase gamma subunit
MLNSLLANVSISEAAIYAVLGFAIVFGGIAFLILVVWLVGKVMVKSTAKPVEKKEKPSSQAATNTLAATETTEEISEETVAVITAAIMAYYQQTQPKCEFTVKRIKRI